MAKEANMADSAAPSPQGSLVYMNLAQRIRMKYPSTWQKQEDTGQFGFVVIFLSPLEGPFDKFSENVNLVIEGLPLGVTLEQYVGANYQQLLQLGEVTMVEEPASDHLGNLPAYRQVYTAPLPGGLAGKYMQYYAIKDDRGFTFTYTAESEKYDKFLEPARQIAASLEAK
jgi:hypothetical protein